MKKIAIIELVERNHYVGDLCKLAISEKTEVSLFIPASFLAQVKIDLGEDFDKVNIELCQKNRFTFLKQIEKKSKDFDLIILNSSAFWMFALVNFKCKVAGYIYNMDWWFKDTISLKIYLKKIFNFHNLTNFDPIVNPFSGAIIRKIILNKLNSVIVEYRPLKDYLENTLKVKKKIYYFPSRTFSGIEKEKTNEKFVVLIPGQIESFRRDYEFVIEAFELIPNDILAKLSLVLLGRPKGNYGFMIIEKLKKLEKSGLEIFYSEKFIEANEFDNKMKNSDLLIAPLKIDFENFTMTERFTYTKGTGSLYDALKYGKPTIVPKDYNIDSEIEEAFLEYENKEDLSNKIIKFCNNVDEFQDFETKAINTLSKLSLGRFRAEFQIFLDDTFSGS